MSKDKAPPVDVFEFDGGFWALAAEAEWEVATWPAWKRRAAERVFAPETQKALKKPAT